jgi:Zn-dependent protease
MFSLLNNNPLSFLVYLLSLFVAITIHEFAHAYTADRLGDPTPGLQGRISLNPLRHLDLYGMLFLFLTGFGWGKPVQFDPFNLKNPRRDAAIISIAGPTSNFILAILLAILIRLFILFNNGILFTIGQLVLVPMIILNIGLGVFNLIPIHPLDGFKIVGGILPEDKAEEWYALQRYGMIFLLILILPIFGSGSMLDMIIRPLSSFIISLLIPMRGGVI